MNENIFFWRMFARRSTLAFFTAAIVFLICILRVAAIATSDYATVAEQQGRLRLTAGKLRGTIYDCNMVPFTNNTKKIIAAVSPTPRAVTAISSVLEGDALTNALERLQNDKPILCEVPEEIICDGIICSTVYSTDYTDFSAKHILGYTDTEGKGVSGIESAYNELLYSDDEVYFTFESTGLGDILEGIEPAVHNDSSVTARGVVTTLDINIQTIAEKHADSLESGAIVIAESTTGKIKAAVSRPDFDITNIAASFTDENSPLFNRVINAYNVGSVFKPCVAAAGIEKGLKGFQYTCTGSCEIIDRFFKCHKWDGHGFTDLRSGLAHSCNTFFYNFAFNIGGNDIYNTATALKFGSSLPICDGISTAKGSLPDKSSLLNIAYLANLSIGQGELLLSPVSMLTLYCAIASDGKYYIPSVVEGTLKDGRFTSYDIGKQSRAMNSETAAILRQYLSAVLSEGTGEDATPETVTAAGKTATAQTGKYENGTEICEGWFCGFFPAENPEYVVIVFSEDTRRQSATCSQIFARIADGITALK